MQYNQIKIYSNNSSVSLHSLGLHPCTSEFSCSRATLMYGYSWEYPTFYGKKPNTNIWSTIHVCTCYVGLGQILLFPWAKLNSAQLVPPLSASGRATGRGAEPSRRGPDGVRRRRLGNGDLASRVAAADCVAVESILPIGWGIEDRF